MNAESMMLRARRVAILGSFLLTIDDIKDRAEFIRKLRDSKAISPLAADMLCEVYLVGVIT